MLYRLSQLVGCLLLLFSSLSVAEKLQLTIESAQGQEKGVVTIFLRADKAPNHVKRIMRLAEEGRYDGVVFHRVIDYFMAQTGDVEYGNSKKYNNFKVGTGGSPYDDLKAEFSEIAFTEGVVGMARSRYIHSANSQFFIVTDSQLGLNGQYTVIGEVVEGMEVVHRIKKGSRAENGKVDQPDRIKSAKIID